MKKVGITGQSGFIGGHLFNFLSLLKEEIQLVPFEDFFFDQQHKMDDFVQSCDVIVHLAGVNRDPNPQVVHDANIHIAEKLIDSLEKTNSKPHIIFSSSTQEEKDNLYGMGKRKAREKLVNWAKKHNSVFTGLIIPNVFGPFGKPYYNSVVATFCHQLSHYEIPQINVDATLRLVYVQELVYEIVLIIRNGINDDEYLVQASKEINVSEILAKLVYFKECYFESGVIPKLESNFEVQLFNTFRCYFDIKNYFPRKFKINTDNRGIFVELVKLGIGGQVSFSTTVPGITRGNHFHLRKIERFAVIKGEALIQLRKIGSNEVFDYYLSGDEPAYVDMPIWYTHNIKNIGSDELYTVFWINETFDAKDPDTYFEIV